jgi:hypothetical protein
MNKQERVARMAELMQPIEQQILMCDNQQDLLMLASAMITSAKHIFILNLGSEVTKAVFAELDFRDE